MRHAHTFLALLLASAHSSAQQVEPGQAVFLMQSEEGFTWESSQYSIKWDSSFALSAINDGSSKFDPQATSSLDLFRLRGGFLGLKPGEKLHFYVIEETASGSATEKSMPRHDCQTTLSRQGRFMQYANGEAGLFEQRPTLAGVPGPVQYSVVNDATFTRTAQGGLLTYSPRIFPCGWENLQSHVFSFGFSKADQVTLGTFVLSETDLRNWQQVRQMKQGQAQVSDTERVNFKATLMGAFEPQDDEEMVFEPDSEYESWIPAPLPERLPGIGHAPPSRPGTLLQVKVKIQPKKPGQSARKGIIYFELEGVTRHKGRCGNYPRGALEKDDMRFAAEQPDGIVVDGPKEAHTKDEVAEATVWIEATDTAGYARLMARSSALNLKAIYKPTNTYALTVPRDDDGNKIADAWERQMGIGSQPNVEADRDRVDGQQRAGDGLTVFDEYRGLITIEDGQRLLRRFDPNLKELLVIDPEELFNAATWFEASKIKAYRLDESMVAGSGGEEASRVANFNTDDVSHSKYAVRVKSIWAKDDPEGEEKQRAGLTPCGECRSPKDADYCAVVVDRVRAKVERLYEKLGRAVANPGGPESQEAAAAGIPAWQQAEALRQLGDSKARAALADQLLKTTLIHEVGHAVAAADHDGTPPESFQQVVKACPMFYPGDRSDLWFIVLQILYRQGAPLSMQNREFCRGVSGLGTRGFRNCFENLNVADW